MSIIAHFLKILFVNNSLSQIFLHVQVAASYQLQRIMIGNERKLNNTNNYQTKHAVVDLGHWQHIGNRSKKPQHNSKQHASAKNVEDDFKQRYLIVVGGDDILETLQIALSEGK